ncbi:MAG: TetR/AcrR family transcriptional regulator [Thermoanaerobaculia bacterium]
MNKKHPTVQDEEGNGAAEVDRRVRRTSHALMNALLELAVAKRYDRITIQDLLDRADIGRSTFYSHYRGKDDLLLRGFARMLEWMDGEMGPDGPETPRLAPVAELFRHVGQVPAFHQNLVRAHMVDRVYQVGTAQLGESIARRLAAWPPERRPGTVPTPLAAQALAGACFGLLRWWLDHQRPETPEEMDRLFHGLWGGG